MNPNDYDYKPAEKASDRHKARNEARGRKPRGDGATTAYMKAGKVSPTADGTMNRKKPRRLHKLTIQKPVCAPSRETLTGILNRHGVAFWDFKDHKQVNVPLGDLMRKAKLEKRSGEDNAGKMMPIAFGAEFRVSADQAGWAEYLIERSGKMIVIKGKTDPRIRGWADKHGGTMPRPWIEESCSEGMDPWKKFETAAREEQNGKRK